MKKVIFLFAMVLAVTMVMAQGNTATTTQNGPDNLATVDQTGTGNGSILLQESADFFPRGMTADIDQIGADNTSDVYQGMYGEHYATVNQDGTSNNAEVVSLRNNETANILQKGENNDAYQRLHGNFGETTIEQVGNWNESDQNIGIYGTAGVNNKFEGYQTGSYNKITQSLSTDYDFASEGNEGVIEQIGDNNTSTQSIGTASTLSSDNKATVYIRGNLNMTEQSIFGDENTTAINLDGHSNEAIQTADGDLNYLETVVNGTGNKVTQIADGVNNFSYMASSYNTHDNVLSSDQTGTSNKVNARIVGDATTGSSGNNIDISQSGDQNWSFSSTKGHDNQIDVSQSGTGNLSGLNNAAFLGILQEGDLNVANLTQTGSYNSSTISQIGNSNNSVVTQSN